MGVRSDSDLNDTDLMFHRVGLRVGSMISEEIENEAIQKIIKILLLLNTIESLRMKPSLFSILL